ncbi:MAG: C40 family peptidase [Hymenobacteraceae bacterium]|nr:C40 family peptidase [Hymenobacteraceae bacterium]
MKPGICPLSIAPLRAEPSDKAEQVTQLVFGECYFVVDEQPKWLRVRIAADGYEGWLDAKQHQPVPDEWFAEYVAAQPHPRTLDVVGVVSDDHTRLPVQLGSVLPFFDGMTLRLGPNRRLFYNGLATNLRQPVPDGLLLRVANLYRGAPYQWGGKSVFGLDCSGFTQQVFGLLGQQLPRDAAQQVAVGEEVHFADQARAGDLAFFDSADGRIVHVGLVVAEGQILHASGEVRLDTLDHHGIFHAGRGEYSHRLRIIKRVEVG